MIEISKEELNILSNANKAMILKNIAMGRVKYVGEEIKNVQNDKRQ